MPSVTIPFKINHPVYNIRTYAQRETVVQKAAEMFILTLKLHDK